MAQNNFNKGPGGRLKKEEAKNISFGFMRPEISPLNQQQFMQVARGEIMPQQTGMNAPIVFGQQPGSIGEMMGRVLTLGEKAMPGQGYQLTPSETAKQTAIDLATGEAIGRGAKMAAPYVKAVAKKAIPLIKETFQGGKMAAQNAIGVSDVVSKQRQMDRFFDLLYSPASKSKEANEVLNDFIQRVKTPEGMRRAKELGINNVEDFLTKVQITDRPSALAYYAPEFNKIALNPNIAQSSVKPITRHELEHAVQSAIKKENPRSKISNIDQSLKKLELRNTPERGTGIRDLESETPLSFQDVENMLYDLKNRQKATNYFQYGSQGREKGAFLGELQQHLLDIGAIKHPYDKITPEMIKDAQYSIIGNPEGHGKFLRILNIMKPTEANYKLLSDNLNKMLAVPPLVAGAVQLNNNNAVQPVARP
jgi:hypothetical protein